MSVVHPAFLFALALGVIPIVIYYLIRFRSLRIEWGASYVLERAIERLRKKLNIEQWILMGLRILAILVLVIAFARPVSTTRARATATGGKHRIVVLDASASMLAGEPGATRWDKALALARRLVGTWGRGERWSLYVVDRDPHWVVDDQAVESPERSQAAFEGLEPSESAASLVRALEVVFRKAAGRDTELYLIADDQALTWKGMDQVARPAGAVRLFWVRPSAGGTGNLAVTRLTLSHDQVLVRHPCRALISVRNFGLQPVENAGIEVLVDGAFHSREQVSLLPGQEAQVAVEVAIEDAGSHAITARLHKDALESDNAASAGIEVIPELSVLVLRDTGRTEKFASAWGFLDLAARVMARKVDDGAPLFGGGPMAVKAQEGQVEAGALAGADVVVVDGGFTLTPAAIGALRAYVRQGGGLVLAADDTVDLKVWNGLLAEAGLLPARLLAARREALGGERFQTLGPGGFEAPGLQALATAADGDIAASRFYSWTELGDPLEGAAVLARFSDGRPFAVDKRFGPGSVILLAAGLNSRNNNLMVREFAYPFLFNLFSEAASAALYPRTVATGNPIRLQLPPNAPPPTAVQFTLQGRPPVPVPVAGNSRVVMLAEGSERSGLASMLVTWKDRFERVWFGIQGERMDSDLQPLAPALREKVLSRLEMVEASNWEELQAKLEAGYRGEEWQHWAVLAVIALLLGEMVIQRRFV
jgi:hypothetical protein